ncbi:MAG: 3-deoxy-7-phosphoheptulonate synthase, partial [Christensenella sp.]
GIDCTVLGVLGDTYTLDKERVGLLNGVERVVAVQEPYKKANRKFHPKNSVIDVAGVKIGGGTLTVMAGPCSVDSVEQLEKIAMQCKASGAQVLRGGAFKPRTSPYAFQGLGEAGLDILMNVKNKTGMPIVTEIMSPKYVELFSEKADIIQIGARNMQNFDLLKEVGMTKKPILLKRGLSSTIEELLMSAEYIMSGGNENVILCERGIRTFETYTRNTLDISAIPAIKRLSHLPVVVDPSHASGLSYMVESLALGAVAAGADGLMIEVHNDPAHALCDGAQSLTPEAFAGVMNKITALKNVLS